MAFFEVDLTGNTVNQGKPYYDFNDEFHQENSVHVKFGCVGKIIDEAIEQWQQKYQSQQDCSGSPLTAYVRRLPKHCKFRTVQFQGKVLPDIS